MSILNRVTGGHRDNPKDLDAARQRLAADQSAAFIDEFMPQIPGHRGADPHAVKLSLLSQAVAMAPADGLAVEFGVASGETLAVIAESRPAHGFDSFEGLPTGWYGDYQEGTFAQGVPRVDNAELHVGWFEDTLPGFLAEHQEAFAFVHMDADLYESTRTVFVLAEDRFQAGTIIVFDEFFNYPGWRNHEHRAFVEFLDATGRECEYVAYNAMHEQLVVRLGSAVGSR